MNNAWDGDGHIREPEVIFSDKYFDSKYRDRMPRVVEVSPGTLRWYWDDRLFPRTVGPFTQVGGTPQTKNGVAVGSANRESDPVESSSFTSPQARLEQLDREHIAVQINYPTMFLSWPLAHDNGLGNAMARAYNDWIADASSYAPDRLKWVSVINPGDPIAAAKEVTRTKDMGSSGVMLLGTVGNKHVDDPSMDVVWDAIAGTGLPVGMHVGFCCPALGDMYAHNTSTLILPFAMTLLMGFERIMISGLLDRYPELRIAFLEAGCSWVPFLVERMSEYSGKEGTRLASVNVALGTAAANRTGYSAQLLPKDYVKRGQVYFGFEPDEELLPYCVEEFGSDCWLYASDIPHFDRLYDAATIVRNREDISEEVKDKILVENVARFYGLPLS